MTTLHLSLLHAHLENRGGGDGAEDVKHIFYDRTDAVDMGCTF